MTKTDLLYFLQTVLQDELIATVELQSDALFICFTDGTTRIISVL